MSLSFLNQCGFKFQPYNFLYEKYQLIGPHLSFVGIILLAGFFVFLPFKLDPHALVWFHSSCYLADFRGIGEGPH